MSNIRYGDFKPSYNEEKPNITQPELFKRRGDIFDLADAFLSIESMTHKKLQKLCYYAKAWYLALYDENLVNEAFEAWVHGAVQPDLYQKYKPYGFNYIPRVFNTKDIPEEFMDFAWTLQGRFILHTVILMGMTWNALIIPKCRGSRHAVT